MSAMQFRKHGKTISDATIMQSLKAERDEWRDKAEVAYSEGWTARAELADKAKAEAEAAAEAGWMAKQEYDGGGAAYHQGFQDGVASCANKQLAKQLAKLKAERDEWECKYNKLLSKQKCDDCDRVRMQNCDYSCRRDKPDCYIGPTKNNKVKNKSEGKEVEA